MTKTKIFKILDLASFCFMLVSAVLIAIFEVTINNSILKLSILFFAIAIAILFTFMCLKIFFTFKKEDKKDELFDLTKKQKIWLIIKTVLVLILLIMIICIFFNIK